MVWSSTILNVFVRNGVGIDLDVSPPATAASGDVGVSPLFCSAGNGDAISVS